jgi:arsenate reductase
VFSGGTEVTAFHANAITALANAGMKIIPLGDADNPVIAIRYELTVRPVYTFSKTFDHAVNPMNSFGAVMNCHHADANCPYIPNAETRFNLWYGDPGQFDGSPSQDQMYADVNRQIATEHLYIASKLAVKLKKASKTTK